MSVAIGGIEMLDQCASVLHIKNLQTTADGKNRKIVLQCFRYESHLGLIAFEIAGPVCFRNWLLAIKLRADVGATSKKQSVRAVEMQVRSGDFQDRIHACIANSGRIREDLGLVAINDKNALAHIVILRQQEAGGLNAS